VEAARHALKLEESNSAAKLSHRRHVEGRGPVLYDEVYPAPWPRSVDLTQQRTVDIVKWRDDEEPVWWRLAKKRAQAFPQAALIGVKKADVTALGWCHGGGQPWRVAQRLAQPL
jgi:hypothetical protein